MMRKRKLPPKIPDRKDLTLTNLSSLWPGSPGGTGSQTRISLGFKSGNKTVPLVTTKTVGFDVTIAPAMRNALLLS